MNQPVDQSTTHTRPSLREDDCLGALTAAVEHAAHLLPGQGPITVFIHHNTLHAFEEQTFTEGVKQGARVFGCEPYLALARYREEMRQGRIRATDLRVALRADLGSQADEDILGLGSRFELRLALLQHPLRSSSTEELMWFVAETDALRRVRCDVPALLRQRLIGETRRWVMRDLRGGNEADDSAARARRVSGGGLDGLLRQVNDAAIEDWDEPSWESFTLRALWRVCCDGAAAVVARRPHAAALRHRDLLLHATGQDADLLTHDVLIRFTAAFLDQGLADWPLPQRELGFYRAFCAVYGRGCPPARWLRGLPAELARLEAEAVSPLESIQASLRVLGVPQGEWDSYLSATLLALRGWGGMVRQLELRGDRAVRPAPTGSLVEFLAVRLLLDRWALVETAGAALGYTGPLAGLRSAARANIDDHGTPSVEQRAFLVFQLAQVLGWTPEKLHRLSDAEWARLLAEIDDFSKLECQRVFHLAYERRFYTRTLDAIANHAAAPVPTPSAPQFQVVCCLDEREESLRRHVEETAPDVETFGVAGFFNVAMYYRGAGDAHDKSLCPIVIRPKHRVVEKVARALESGHRRARTARRLLGRASHRIHVGSRSVAFGALLAGGFGVLASVPLVARILFPRLTARARRLCGHVVRTPPRTVLELECDTPGSAQGLAGFTLDEMIDIGERLLRDIGLTARFARLVVLLGHGSQSLNNPHNSAYNCGACGGAAGGPNARAAATILNEPRVRAALTRRGLAIPASTWFVGGYHNTCNDHIDYFDLELVPATHEQECQAAQQHLLTACQRNAHERCRRFMSAPLDLSFAAAQQHVEERSEDLAQTRPECGHATNSICIVGRRAWTRGLFLDRRAFLTSYDPAQDDAEHTILTRILQAVFPVCAGINLEYYFSYVDNTGWGCGTKLPHNVSALVGVMDGAASDLRTGLPWQMVEIHEPVRLLFVIEATADTMLRIMERDAGIGRLCRHGWVELTLIHPETHQLSVFRNGRFEPYKTSTSVLPRAASSCDWYRGWRDHLEFAAVSSGR